MVNLLIWILLGVIIVAVVYWLLGEIITDGKLLKIARVIVAVIALIYLIGLLTGYVGTPHTLLIR